MPSRAGGKQPSTHANAPVAAGAVLGVLVSISSVGAGAIGVTALILLLSGTLHSADCRHGYRARRSVDARGRAWPLAAVGSVDLLIIGSLLLDQCQGCGAELDRTQGPDGVSARSSRLFWPLSASGYC